MRRTCLVLLCSLVALKVASQPAAPVVASLGAYAQQLQSPARLTVDSAGSVYVTDPPAGRVVVFDAFGRPTAAHAGFASPLGIAVDAQGRIYLGEEGSGSVSVFDAQWNLLYKLGIGDGEFQLPNHLVLAESQLYVSDSKANAVKVYLGGTRTNQFGVTGNGAGQFDFPTGICVSTQGEVFVVDQNNDRIQVFDREGHYLRGFSLGSSVPSGRSQAASVDAFQRLYVADSYQGIVKVYDAASGALLSSVGGFGRLPGELDSPAGLALDAIHRLFVTSANTRRVELYGLDAFIHLTTQPASGTIASGAPLTLTATTGGSGAIAYQWRKNGVAIVDATNGTFTIDRAATTDAGNYSVAVTGPSGTFTSSIAPVAVMVAPRILSDPESLTVLRGSNVAMSVSAEGSALSYQWLLNGWNLDGATGRTLALPDVQPFQAGLYSVRVSNPVGSAVSAAAHLAVIVPPTVMEIISSAIDTNKSFHLTLNVAPGFAYSLDASTNLFEWEPLTNLTHDLGLIEFMDADSTNYWNRYYRLRWIP